LNLIRRKYVFHLQKRNMVGRFGLRVDFEIDGGLFSKTTTEEVSAAVGRRIQDGRQRLDGEGEREVSPAVNWFGTVESHGRR